MNGPFDVAAKSAIVTGGAIPAPPVLDYMPGELVVVDGGRLLD